MVGVPFWVHSVIILVVGSLIVNPTGWCLVGDSQATGGNADFTIWFLAFGAGLFMIFYGLPFADAVMDNGKKFMVHSVLVGAVFVFIMWVLIGGGHLIIDKWEDAIWCLMVLSSMLGGLAKMEVSQKAG